MGSVPFRHQRPDPQLGWISKANVSLRSRPLTFHTLYTFRPAMEDIEVAMQTGELDGIVHGPASPKIISSAGRDQPLLTNNISGAWADRSSPIWIAGTNCQTMQTLFRVCCDQRYYRQWWYWGGEAALRVNGPKLN
jgi:hypothetical protein